MPKARRSKKAVKVGSAQSRVVRDPQNIAGGRKEAAVSAPSARANRRFATPRVAGPQSLILPSMVALGCWGMAISFAYFYNDPNHFIFAGMAVLMALLWTYSVVVRARKLLVPRQTK